nr:hypothetical protein [uncultured Roseococcus sp.]
MSLSAERVAEAYRLFTGRTLNSLDAERTAKLLSSREELVATIVTRDRVFDTDPSVVATLRKVAAHAYAAPKTPRLERGDAVLLHQAAKQFSASLDALIRSENNRRSVVDQVHDALRHQTVYWVESSTHPGYQWCVAREPRD